MTDRDPHALDARLRAALDLDARRPDPVDMSSEAITARLIDAAELSRLCLDLAVASTG